jgi:hypothetical protein
LFVFKDQLAKQPIPQSKSELTGHPLYVLKSKLLKFEGIYPNDTQPVGWLKVRIDSIYMLNKPVMFRRNQFILEIIFIFYVQNKHGLKKLGKLIEMKNRIKSLMDE